MAYEVADRSYVESLLLDPYAGSDTEYELRIGDKDYRLLERVRSCSRDENDDQGIGISLQATIDGHLPPNFANQRVELDLLYGRERIRRFTGYTLPPRTEGVNTIITAHTGGFWLDKIKLNKYRQFSGVTPYSLCYEMLTRMPYDKEFITVPEVVSPKFFRRAYKQVLDNQGLTVNVPTGSQGYPPWTACGQPLSDVSVRANLSFRDNALNGCTGAIKRVHPPASEWQFTLYGSQFVTSEPRDLEVGPWHDVVVFRQQPDTTEPEYLAGPELVPGSPAPIDATLWLESSDETPEAKVNAVQHLTDVLDGLSGVRRRGTWAQKIIHPFLTRGSAVSVIHIDEDDDGPVQRRWEGTLVGLTDTYDSETQTYVADLRLVQTTRPEPPPIILAGVTGQTAPARIRRDSDDTFIFDVGWITRDSLGTMVVDEALAAQDGVLITSEAGQNSARVDMAALA